MPPERHSEVWGWAAFGLVIWLMIVAVCPAWALVLAAASWLRCRGARMAGAAMVVEPHALLSRIPDHAFFEQLNGTLWLHC